MRKKVTKEDFEVLSKYMDGEVEYYINFTSAPKTTTKHKTTKRKKRGTTSPKHKPGVIGMRFNRALMMGPKWHSWEPTSTRAKQTMMIMKLVFQNEPTRVIGQTDLRDILMRKTGYPQNWIQPFVSDLIHRHGVLRIK